jgi:hypothetical protein
MARKIILALAGLAASLTIAVGLTAAGFAPAAAPNGPLVSASDDGEDVVPARKAVEPEVVYVKPAPKRRTVVRTVTDRPSRNAGFISSGPRRAASRVAHEDREREDRAGEHREDREHEDREHESGERD